MVLAYVRSRIQFGFGWSIAILFFTLVSEQAVGQNWASEMSKINESIGAPFKVDEKTIQAVGLRKLEGKHIVIYTDAAQDPRVEELTKVFDEAVPQWCDYFGVRPEKASNWKMRVYLIADEKNPEKFYKAVVWPTSLPDFKAGYQKNHDIWLYLQPGPYYTRHLLLHEGTHAFMQWFKGGYGAPWYGEGIAELLASHRWKNGELDLNYRIQERSEAPYWARVKRIKDERDTNLRMSLTDVLTIPPTAYKEVRYYAWSWAACEFFSQQGTSQQAFRIRRNYADRNSSDFNASFQRGLGTHWQKLESDWQLFINELDYGTDASKTSLRDMKQLTNKPSVNMSEFELLTDHGWQMTSIPVKTGDVVRIMVTGQFRIGETELDEDRFLPWTCEGNGITIRYHLGRPLGRVLAGTFNKTANSPLEKIKGITDPIDVGKKAEIKIKHDGFLCFRINESTKEMSDNQGTLAVRIVKLE